MAHEIAKQAAYNNAIWCDAVCATHFGPGAFSESHWLNRHGVPPYYPDLITLTGVEDVSVQVEALATLLQQAPHNTCFVKDSFNCLDLQAFGFTSLFSAEWLLAPALGTEGYKESKDVNWVTIANKADLRQWEHAWHPPDGTRRPRTFRPNLLSRPEIRFVYGLVDGVPAGGGILTAAAGVTGVSNLFASQIGAEVVLQGLATCANQSFPGLPVVGYESGNDLAAAYRVGFTTVGHLRVWGQQDL